MYQINQQAILGAKFGLFLGIPLLSSFLVARLAMYRPLSVVLIFIGYWLNNSYPEKIDIRPDCVALKLFLRGQWLEIPNDQLSIEVKPQYLLLYDKGKPRYRISAKKLSVRLYKQLEPFLQSKAAKMYN